MSLKKNFIYNTSYQLLNIFLPLITVPYIARVLGVTNTGIYSYTGAYTQYFILLGMLGINIYGRRQIAYVKDNKEKLSRDFSNIYTLQLISTLISLVSYLIIFVGINEEYKIVYLIQGINILASVVDISWLYIGFENIKSIVLKNLIVKVIGIIMIFTFVKTRNDLIIYAVIMSGSLFIGQLLMWINMRKIIDFVKPEKKEIIKHLKPTLGLFISQMAIQVYALLDKTMLGAMTDTWQVGLYENSQKTIKIILTIATSLGTIMLPRMSSLYSNGKIGEFKKLIYNAFSFVNFIAFPMVFGLIAISNRFAIWFYGVEFTGIEVLLKLGSFIIIAISWSNILGMQVMIPMQREKEFTISVVVGAIVNLILNLFLIKSLKASGAMISSIVAETTVAFVQVYLLRHIVNWKRILLSCIKPFIGSVSMYIIIGRVFIEISSNFIYLISTICGGCIVYMIIMILLKDIFIKEALNTLRRKVR